MTARKKKGIGYLISGVAFIGVGSSMTFWATGPEWLPMALNIVGLVVNALGFVAVFPDTDA